MSNIRARYDGPSATGVELLVELQDGQTYPVQVKKNGLLPEEVGGQSVAASFRNKLLEQEDWSEFRQSDSSSDKSNKE